MPTELIIIMSCIVLWVILHFSAYPGTNFAEWGDKKFGYGKFLTLIAIICFVPAVITGVIWLYNIYQSTL